MSKVLVDRDLLERLMRADADMGREGSASFTLDASDRLDRAWAELRAILAKPEDPEGFEIARHSKRLVEQLRSDLSAVTAERDRLRDEIEALRGQLAESQANDRTAMGYLSDVRQIVGGDDFPSMVANVARMAEIRCEGCGYMTHHREHMGCVRAAMAAKEASDEPS